MQRKRPDAANREGSKLPGRDPTKQPNQHLLGPNSKEFAYLVATYAWRYGLTANSITREIFNDASSHHLMQVKRALQRAQLTCLTLTPPISDRMTEKLDKLVNKNQQGRQVAFHVVEDTHPVVDGPVYAKAAELVAQFIREAAEKNQKPPQPGEIVICNAGGRTVAGTVRALRQNPPVVDDSSDRSQQLAKSLMFVAANAAYQPTKFDRSANFLSVTMGEVFGASHFALPTEKDKALAAEHKALVGRTALFICGAGACHSGNQSGLMTQYFEKKGWDIPEEAVGDLAFYLLDRKGDEVQPPSIEARDFMRQLNPSLDLATLMRIGNNNRVLLILQSKDTHTKVGIGTAVLRNSYATDVVLGTHLAAQIVKEWGKS